MIIIYTVRHTAECLQEKYEWMIAGYYRNRI